MTANFVANPGSGGDTFGADDLGTYKIPYSKIDIGAAGASSPVTAANPLPVSVGAPVAVTGTFYQATQPVSGTVAVSNFPATQPVSIAATVPVTGTFWQTTQPVSIASMPSTPVTGTFWQTTQPVSLATNTPTLQAGSTTTVTQATGTNLHAVLDTGSTTAVTQSTAANLLCTATINGTGGLAATKASGTAAATTDIAQVVTISPNLPVPTASFISSAATTNATSVKASAGTVFNITASNTGAAAAYVKFYNKASAPTVGTDVPVFTMSVPASGTVTIAPALVGIRFGTGIALAITNLAADSDTTAVLLAQVKVATSYI